jgi:hypothetical protein
MPCRHPGQPRTERAGWQAGDGAAKPLPAPAAAHRLASGVAGVGKVQVFDRDRGDAA